MGLLGLFVSLETVRTAIWEFWPLFCNLSANKYDKSDHENGDCLESVCKVCPWVCQLSEIKCAKSDHKSGVCEH